MISATYNSNGTIPDWSVTHSQGLTTFASNELRLKKVVTTQQWQECAKSVGFNINSEVAIYENLKGICEYFTK